MAVPDHICNTCIDPAEQTFKSANAVLSAENGTQKEMHQGLIYYFTTLYIVYMCFVVGQVIWKSYSKGCLTN